MYRNASLVASTLAAIALTSGCASQRTQRLDDALLSEVSASQMALVHEARDRRTEAEDALAKAIRDAAWAEDQTELARAELKSHENQVEEAKLAVVLAERNGTTVELESATNRFDLMASKTDASREKLALRKRELEHARLLQKLALEKSRLAAAEVDLAKARAVQDLDRVAAQKIPVREYEKEVRFHKTEVALAEVMANSAAEYVDDARLDLETAEARAASFQRN